MPMTKNDGKTVPAVNMGCHAGNRCCLNAELDGRFDFTLFSITSLFGILMCCCFLLLLLFVKNMVQSSLDMRFFSLFVSFLFSLFKYKISNLVVFRSPFRFSSCYSHLEFHMLPFSYSSKFQCHPDFRFLCAKTKPNEKKTQYLLIKYKSYVEFDFSKTQWKCVKINNCLYVYLFFIP